jgi:phosphohistidine phosphatase
MGVFLRESDVRPDLVLCSPAARTRETLELLDLAGEPNELFEDVLYGASGASILARLRRVGDDVETVLLIGHNPGVQDAAIGLAADPTALPDKFPTGGLADLRLGIRRWVELEVGIAELGSFVVPRDLSPLNG